MIQCSSETFEIGGGEGVYDVRRLFLTSASLVSSQWAVYQMSSHLSVRMHNQNFLCCGSFAGPAPKGLATRNVLMFRNVVQ